MSQSQIRNEALLRISLQPVHLRPAEVDPWKDDPESLIEFIQEKSIHCSAFVDDLAWGSDRILFARYHPEWTKIPVDLVVMNLEVDWHMKQNGEIYSLEDCGPDRGPLIRFNYDVITDENTIYEEEMQGLLNAFAASILRLSIESLRRSGKLIEDPRKH